MNKMKKNKKTIKNWKIDMRDLIDLNSHSQYLGICAVDSITDQKICDLISFESDGSVIIWTKSKERLIKEGYDPWQYKNKWDDDGGIIINHCSHNLEPCPFCGCKIILRYRSGNSHYLYCSNCKSSTRSFPVSVNEFEVNNYWNKRT